MKETGYYPLDFAIKEKSGFIEDNDFENPLKACFKKLVSSRIEHDAFTDNEDETCEVDVGFDIPVGALVWGWAWEVLEDVALIDEPAGDATGIVLTLGDGTDVDRFDPVTDPSGLFAAFAEGAQGFVCPVLGAGGSGDGELHVTSAVATPTLTVTFTGGEGPLAADFVDAAATGAFRITVFYFDFSLMLS